MIHTCVFMYKFQSTLKLVLKEIFVIFFGKFQQQILTPYFWGPNSNVSVVEKHSYENTSIKIQEQFKNGFQESISKIRWKLKILPKFHTAIKWWASIITKINCNVINCSDTNLGFVYTMYVPSLIKQPNGRAKGEYDINILQCCK